MDLSSLSIQKATAPALCINAGCVKTSSIPVNTTTFGIQSEIAPGFMFYNNTTGPCGVVANISNTPTLNVCSRQTSTCSPNKWGTATVTNNCNTPSSKCVNVLPISLLFFKCSKGKEGVKVFWATAAQWDIDHFVIERSTNGQHWETVGTVATEDKKSVSEYSLIDHTPTHGINYYRLSEIDIKGVKKEYEVTFIEFNHHQAGFALFPNPGHGDLQIDVFGSSEKYEFEITDIAGIIILRKTLTIGYNFLEDAVNTPGVYYAKLKVGKEQFSQKFIVH